MAVRDWFYGIKNFSELEPEDRLRLLFHALTYIARHRDLSAREIRRRYREEFAPYRSEEAIYRLFDNLYWLGAVAIEYRGFPARAYYIITPKGERILRRGYISREDLVDTPEWFIRRLTRPARRIEYYHLIYVIAPYAGARRNLEIEFEGDVPARWWELQKDLEERGVIPENVIIAGIREAILELAERVGYSRKLWVEGVEKPEGGQVRPTATPTGIVEFRIMDYDQTPSRTTAEGSGDAGLEWSIGDVLDIRDNILTAIGEPITHFVGKKGRSGRPRRRLI